MTARSFLFVAIVFLLTMAFIPSCRQAGPVAQSPIKEVGRYDFGTAYDVLIEGRTAYVSGNDGVHIMDTQNPRQPQEISLIRINDGAFGLFVEQNTAYIAGQKDGVFIVDVSDPKNPEIIGVYSEKKGIFHEDIIIRRNYGFVSLRDGRLIVLDVSDKSEPKRVGELKIGAGGRELGIYQNIIYFDSYGGLEVINVNDPSSPQKIYTVPETQGASGIHVHERILFLGCHSNGVRILDISNPRLPRVVGSFNDGGESNGVYYKDPYLFVADQNDQFIEILNVSDPTRPYKLAENHNDDYVPHNIFFDGRYIYAADAKNGLVVFEYNPNLKD